MGNLLHTYRSELRSTLDMVLADHQKIEREIVELTRSLKGCEAFFAGAYSEYSQPGDSPDRNMLATLCGLRELYFVFCANDPRKELDKLRCENNRYRKN